MSTRPRGGSRGRTRRAPPSPKSGKNMIFCVKSWFFTRNTPKLFAPRSARRVFFKCAPSLEILDPPLRPTALHTKKGYDVATGDFWRGISRIDISRGFKKRKFTWKFRRNGLRKLKIIAIFSQGTKITI